MCDYTLRSSNILGRSWHDFIMIYICLCMHVRMNVFMLKICYKSTVN